MELSAKLLGINPESYTAWNYRKLAVEQKLSQSESDPDSLKSIFDEELRVVRLYVLHFVELEDLILHFRFSFLGAEL